MPPAQRLADDDLQVAGEVRWHDGVDARRLKGLEDENRRLKQLLADAMLDNQALKGLLAKNW